MDNDCYCNRRLINAEPPPYAALINSNMQLLAEAVKEMTFLRAFMETGNTWLYFYRMMQALREHADNAIKDAAGKRYVCASVRRMCRDGGSPKRASACIAMFSLFGLIEKVSDAVYLSEGTELQIAMADGYYRNVSYRKPRGIMWYHVPEFTERLLSEADRLAAIWQNSGLSRDAISKAVLIHLYGFELADRAYGNNRVTASRSRREVECLLCVEADYLVRAKGYFVPDELLRRLIGEDRDIQYIRSIWAGVRPFILKNNGWKYGKPSKEEKRRYGLTMDRWIIRPP